MDKLSEVSFIIEGGSGYMGYCKTKNEKQNYIQFIIKDGFKYREALKELVDEGFTNKFATSFFPVDLKMHKSEKNDKCVVEIILYFKDNFSISNYITTNDDFNKFSYWEYLAETAVKKVKNGLLFNGEYDDEEEIFTPTQTYEEFMDTRKKK